MTKEISPGDKRHRRSEARPEKTRGKGMLVLTRKIDQGIVISGKIYVRVLDVERDRVKIGISAPLEITVLRQELLERENQQSVNEPSAEPEENGQPNGS